MGRVIRNNIYQILWQYFRGLFRVRGDFDCGTVSLSHGRWILFFDTAEPPANVWFQVSESETSMPICGGSTTLLGASMMNNGFYLYADVRSNEAEIHWFASEF